VSPDPVHEGDGMGGVSSSASVGPAAGPAPQGDIHGLTAAGTESWRALFGGQRLG
jgi:hypothetical protein